MRRKKRSLNNKYNNFVKTVITSKIPKGASLTGGCRPLGDQIGVSFATLHAILMDRQLCSERTAAMMAIAGWFNLADVGMTADTAQYRAKRTPKSQPYTPPTPKKTYQQGYDEGHALGLSKGNIHGFSKGKKLGYAEGKKDGEDIGYEEGYCNGKAVASHASSFRSRSGSNNSSPNVTKLKKLLNLKRGSDSDGESNAASIAASKILSKVIKEQLGLDISVNIG